MLPHPATLVVLAVVFQVTAAPAETRLSAYDPLKHLVCDDRLIAEIQGLTLAPGQVAKDPHNPLFQADQPWENALNNLYPNVHCDPKTGRFDLWYKCVLNDKDVIGKLSPVRTIHDQGWLLLHATSDDGVRWMKPDHGIVSFDGATHNNAVARDTPNVGVFHDAHDPDPARRFKMVNDEGSGEMRVRFSADGLHWTEPVKPEGFNAKAGDTHTNAFFDERSGKYVLFTKHYLGERLVARYESDDFLHWSGGAIVMRSTPEEGKKHQTYCMEVFPYGSGYLGQVMMYHAGTDKSVDCELAWSPDTMNWRRLFPGQAFIPRGPAGSYDSMCIYAPAGRSVIRDGSHMIIYGGSSVAHIGWKRHCLPCLARVREDGFVCLQTGAAPASGSLVTRRVRAMGKPLQISADVANGGSIKVEVLDAPGFDLNACAPVTGNVTGHTIHWTNADFASLKDRELRLKFELRDAKLCSISGVALTSADPK